MRHEDQVRAELQAQYDSLTDHIAAINRDLANELDAERKLVLNDKWDQLDAERRTIVDRMQVLSVSRDVVPTAAIARGGRAVEYDELQRMMYELKTDVTILKNQLSDHLTRCGAESTGFPPHILTFLAVSGVVMLLLLAFLVIRIGIPG